MSRMVIVIVVTGGGEKEREKGRKGERAKGNIPLYFII
jgi:hypothetical protein